MAGTLVLGAAGCGGNSGDASGNSSKASGSSSASSSNNSGSQNSNSSDADSSWIKWKLESAAKPEFADSTFMKVKSTQTGNDDYDIIKPSFVLNYDEIVKKLRDDDTMKSHFAFADKESTELKIYDNDKGSVKPESQKCITEKTFCGFANKNEGDAWNGDFGFTVKYDTSLSDEPVYYFLSFDNEVMTQDEIFAVTSKVFGEEIAKFFVYSDEGKESYKAGNTKGDYFFDVDVKTPDGKTTYKLYRGATFDKNRPESNYVNFSISVDAGIKNNNFRDIEAKMPLPLITLNDTLKTDLGSADHNDLKNFYSKIMNYNIPGDEHKGLARVTGKVDNITFDSGNVRSMFNYNVWKNPVSEDERASAASAEAMVLKQDALKTKDGKTNVHDLEGNIMISVIMDSNPDDTAKVEQYRKAMYESGLKAANDIFGKNNIKETQSYDSNTEAFYLLLNTSDYCEFYDTGRAAVMFSRPSNNNILKCVLSMDIG